MSEKPKFNCDFFGALAGAQKSQALVEKGSLTAETGEFCEAKIPATTDLCTGQNIDCLGPKDHNCPYPDRVTIVES